MKSTIWQKFESDGNDGFPKGITVEICEKLGNKVEFDKNYSQLYFIPENGETLVTASGNSEIKLKEPNDLKKSCEWVEKKIYDDSKKSKWEPVDILRILAWKTGKINHLDSKDTKPEIKYFENWEEEKTADKFVRLQIPYQEVVEWEKFEPIAKSIIEIRDKYCDSKDKDYKDDKAAWKSIIKLANKDNTKEAMRGIGTVYLITLLHFITDGNLPIYDRFAMASLAIWKLKKERNELNITDKSIIRGCKLPSKDTTAAENILESGIYMGYKSLLEEFCKDNYGKEDVWKTDRDVDRALWVFGYFFEVD